MKTVIWKSDLAIFKSLSTFISIYKDEIKEFTNFYVYEGNVDVYEIIKFW